MSFVNEINSHSSSSGAYEKFLQDPYLGYDSLMNAVNDCKASSQAEVVARILARENVYVSGPAGSGKSTVVSLVEKIIDDHFEGNFIFSITASTGLAASNIGGRTIHSFSGLGVFEDIFPLTGRLTDEMLNVWRVKESIIATDILVIDEISMLHAFMLDNVNNVFKRVRKDNRPFGGVQVILMGDFMQLPPVTVRSLQEKDHLNKDFVITSDAWKEADLKVCYLDKTHRATDPKLKHMLFRIAKGDPDETTMSLITEAEQRVRDESKAYTVLYTKNKNVDFYNNEKLAENPNPSVFLYPEAILGKPKDVKTLKDQNKIPDVLEVKEGAIVIVTANNNELEVYNGTVARFHSYDKTEEKIRIILNNGRVVDLPRTIRERKEKVNAASGEVITKEMEEKLREEGIAIDKRVSTAVAYFPIKLGYAITVHKSQGQTFDGVEVDLSDCFVPGLGYVALSRVRSAEDLIITDFNMKALKVDPKSLKYSNKVKKQALMNRKQFIEDIDRYDKILTDPSELDKLWDVSQSGMHRLMAP